MVKKNKKQYSAEEKFKLSNAAHSRLSSLNCTKMLTSSSEKDIKQANIKRAYHDSVIASQKHCGRVLTASERKYVHNKIEHYDDGRQITFFFKK